MRFQNWDIRLIALTAAIVLYAAVGLPTPNNPGWVELFIGALLAIAVGAQGLISAARHPLFIYGMTVPVVVGIFQGHDAAQMLRDIAPFLFMLLPLFLSGFLRAQEQFFKITLCAVVFSGAAFSLRALAEHIYPVLFMENLSAELTYLANAPTILFSALLLAGIGAGNFMRTASIRTIAAFIALGALALILLLPVVLTIQRATLAYAAFFAVALTIAGFMRAPKKVFVLLVVAVGVLLPLQEILSGIVELGGHKTNLVGLNMRAEEALAALREISASPLTLAFGQGWGAGFESPAVAGVRVNYTHGLLTSMMLKAGLAGLVLTCLYMAWILRLLFDRVRDYPVLTLALLGPILIDTFLYASFKSLDFGLVLLLAAAIPDVAKRG